MKFGLAVAGILLFAGCVAPSAARIEPASLAVSGGSSTWTGQGLAGDPNDGDFHGVPCLPYACAATYMLACGDICIPTCGATNCETRIVDVPVGASGDLVVAAQSLDQDSGLWAQIADASGKIVAQGEPAEYAGVARLEHPAPGKYEARVIMAWGNGKYEASARMVPPTATDAGPKRDLLPDLVTLTPRDLRIESPGSDGQPVVDALGGKGCSSYEFVEAQARRCLRFSNAVGNRGEGRLQVVLSQQDLATGAVGQARFTQVIDESDGTARTQPVGAATFHPTHEHYHYAGLAHYDLYALDTATGARGAKAAEGKKSGFCFLDSGLQNVSDPARLPYFYTHANCFDFLFSTLTGNVAKDEVMGISPGWYDFYNWFLDDQFIDISGVHDGDYELVSCANSEKTIVESNLENNCASVKLRLAGDQVTTLA